MKTDHVPALVMLIAGAVYCLMRIRYNVELIQFLTQLLTILIVFWVAGGVLKIVLDKTMNVMADETVTEHIEEIEKSEENAEETIENIEAEELH